MHQIENLGNDGDVCINLDPNNNMHKDMYALDDLVGTEFASNANFIVSTRACSAHLPNRSVVLVYDLQAKRVRQYLFANRYTVMRSKYTTDDVPSLFVMKLQNAQWPAEHHPYFEFDCLTGTMSYF